MTYSLYDGPNPVAELNSSGSVTAINTFGAAGLVSRNVTGYGNTLYAFDERGNVAHRTYQDGHLTSSDLYDGFDKQRAGASDAFGFGGQAGYYTDGETGLLLCTNRFYDPQQGRFLTRDPLGHGGGINLYGYTANDPVNGMDPSGLAPGRHFSSLNAHEGNIWSGGGVRLNVISLSLPLRVRKSS